MYVHVYSMSAKIQSERHGEQKTNGMWQLLRMCTWMSRSICSLLSLDLNAISTLPAFHYSSLCTNIFALLNFSIKYSNIYNSRTVLVYIFLHTVFL